MIWWLDKELRKIRGTTHYRIADLPEVTVGRIVGVARPLDDQFVQAPLTGRTCLAYCARGDDTTTQDEELAAEVGGCRFLVEDASGTAIIDPANAHCALELDDKRVTSFSKVTELQRAWLARVGGLQRGLTEIHSLRLHEGIVEAGETVSIVGFGQRIDGTLVMSSSPRLPLTICDIAATTKT